MTNEYLTHALTGHSGGWSRDYFNHGGMGDGGADAPSTGYEKSP